MTFDNVVATRRAFSVRREQLFQDFVTAYAVRTPAVRLSATVHWAKCLEQVNDAEMAFSRLVQEAA